MNIRIRDVRHWTLRLNPVMQLKYVFQGFVWHVGEGDSGVVAIEPVEVALQVLLVAGELEELPLVACVRGALKKVGKVLIHCVVISIWEIFESFIVWLGLA